MKNQNHRRAVQGARGPALGEEAPPLPEHPVVLEVTARPLPRHPKVSSHRRLPRAAPPSTWGPTCSPRQPEGFTRAPRAAVRCVHGSSPHPDGWSPSEAALGPALVQSAAWRPGDLRPAALTLSGHLLPWPQFLTWAVGLIALGEGSENLLRLRCAESRPLQWGCQNCPEAEGQKGPEGIRGLRADCASVPPAGGSTAPHWGSAALGLLL